MKKGDGGGWRERPLEEERRKVRREIQARTKRYVPIPEGFDARRASAEQLARVSTAAAAGRQGPARALGGVAGAAGSVRPAGIDSGSTVAMYQINAAPGDGSGGDTDGAGSGASGRWSTSRNWSGGLILSRRSNRFSQVAAEWRVPPVSAGSGPGPFVCSTWVGLDGYRGWLTSMPQMGTTQVFGDTGAVDDDGNPLPAQYAWCQWWLRGRQQLQLPIILGGVPVLPWHKVVCWVSLLAPDNPDPGDRHWAHFAAGGAPAPQGAAAGGGRARRQVDPPLRRPITSTVSYAIGFDHPLLRHQSVSRARDAARRSRSGSPPRAPSGSCATWRRCARAGSPWEGAWRTRW